MHARAKLHLDQLLVDQRAAAALMVEVGHEGIAKPHSDVPLGADLEGRTTILARDEPRAQQVIAVVLALAPIAFFDLDESVSAAARSSPLVVLAGEGVGWRGHEPLGGTLA